MILCIPLEARVRTIIRASFIIAKRTSEIRYSLSGDSFQMSEITSDQVLILPDTVDVSEGQAITDELRMQALPIESFITVSAEEALPNALGLLLRLAVEDGRLTDEELLSIQPVLDGRSWRPGLAVQIGDVFSYNASLWRCLQAHTTQSDWPPDCTPALWRKVEVIHEDEVRVWQTGVDYIIGDEVAYPDVTGDVYVCQQAHQRTGGRRSGISPCRRTCCSAQHRPPAQRHKVVGRAAQAL